jgi:hypothetical protein
MAWAPPVKATLPVLVTVRVRALLVVPTAQLPKANGFGVTVAVRIAAVPVPVSVTGEPVTGTLAVMVSVPLYDCTAVGANVTLMVQVAPAAKVAPQFPPVREKPAGKAPRVMPVRVAPPVLLSVRSSALVVVTTTLPNASGDGDTVAIAIAGATNSTAPTSTALLAFREVPKKSKLGAAA